MTVEIIVPCGSSRRCDAIGEGASSRLRRAAPAGAAMLALILLSGPGSRPFRTAAPVSPREAALPAGLESVAQRTLGSGERSFLVHRRGASLSAAGGGITSVFDAAGVRISADGGTVDLRLLGVGTGRRLAAVAPAAPVAASDVVRYRRGGLLEWYRNGPVGLEQGFTLASRPAAGASPLILVLGLGGSLVAHRTSSGVAFVSAGGVPVLRYDGLAATDASGRPLRTALALTAGRLLLRVWDGGARYPLRIDPFIQQGVKLTGSDETGEAGFGDSVALSADGSTALIGGDSDDENTGAAWVFTRSGSGWVQQGAKLTEPQGGLFGASVALSADGDTALVGAPNTNDVAGAAWVFTRSGSTWTQEGRRLTAKGEIDGAWFGASVALSADGDTALIGGPDDSHGAGAAWVFARSGREWQQRGTALTAPGDDDLAGGFGTSVAISGDGNTALVGGNDAAWVFVRSSRGVWARMRLGSGGGSFGSSVALSADGKSALIGDSAPTGPGAAWLFTRSARSWIRASRLTAEDETAGGQFGESVALSAAGTMALIGGPLDADGTGAAWVFTHSERGWTRQGARLEGNGASDDSEFGSSVALSATGDTALSGGFLDDNGAGAVWAFTPRQ